MPSWSYPTEKCNGSFDILPNISVVTGAATELGLLYRETANQRVRASAISDHEQSGGHRE